MKKLLKLVFIGVVAGMTYKFLAEKGITASDIFAEAKEWVTDKAGKLEKLALAEESAGSGRSEKSHQAYYSNSSLSRSADRAVPSGDNYSNDAYSGSPGSAADDSFTDESYAEEFFIADKPAAFSENFRELDRYAMETPATAEETLQSLAAWLISPASDDLEKTRLIFTWIATNVSYDYNGYRTGNYADVSAEGVLRNRVSVCEGYSNLFCELGRLAGLDIVKIIGYAKGLSYTPGKRFSDTNHAWNAVKIDGQWKLFDVTWAVEPGSEIDDFWFSTRPDEFIFTHLPEDDSWQLLQTTVTKSQFEEMPFIQGSFFELGFSGSQCLPLILEGSLRELPDTYHVKGRIKVVSLPFSGNIRSGKTIKVRIKSADAVRVAYKNNGSITDMQKNGDEFSATVKAVPGEFKLMARFDENDYSYHTFLEYEVN